MEHLSASRPLIHVCDSGTAAFRSATLDVTDIRCLRTRVARRLDQPQPRAGQANPRSGHLDASGPCLDAGGPGTCERRTVDAFAQPRSAALAGTASGRAVEPL